MRLFLFSAVVLAASAASPSQQTLSQQICRTALFTKQGSGGTSTIATTQYYTRTITSTQTPTVTVTPKSTTVVTKSTSTKYFTKTLPQTTNTFSQTLSFSTTSTAYTTLVATSTSWATLTATSTCDTLTISPSSGFIPLSSALAASGHAVAKKARRGHLEEARDAEPEAEPDARFGYKKQAASQKIICGSDGSITYDPPIFRGTVTCYKRVTVIATKVITATARSTRTITAPRGTVTSTSVSTTTKTITETPIAASTTLTFSTTQTVQTTSTILSTTTTSLSTTTTAYLSQPTFYAACATSNIVSFVDNERIYSIATTDPDNGFSFGNSTTSAYDCCVQCVNTGSCGGSTFHPASGTCYFFPVVGAGTCVATSQSGTFARQSGTNVGFEVSNSNCGQLGLVA